MQIMKKYISIALCLAALAATSCKGFLDQPVVSEISSETLLSSQNEMELVANYMINTHMPDYSNVGLASGDHYTDLSATKSHRDFYRPSVNVTSKEGSWGSGNWALIRRANYIIANIERGRNNVPKEIFEHYKGLGYFWRAYGYYPKVSTFSNVPWIDYQITDVEDPRLFNERDDRELVMHNTLMDLNIACDSLSTAAEFVTDSRVKVNKYVALAFKARVCLYEGTYRKYHAVNPATQQPWSNEYETAEDFLREAVKACEALINSGKFKLHGSTPAAYGELFRSEVIPTDEVIWSCQYSEALPKYHDITWYFNSATYGQMYSPTAAFVNHYLKTDGKPLADHHLTLANIYTGRDGRMAQTILAPGHKYVNGSKTLDKSPDMTMSRTGYCWVKYSIENYDHYSKALDATSLPIFRYGETLLIYAEAKAELGEMTEDIWNKTIKPLRARGGVSSVYPGSAAYVPDTWLQNYYNSVSPKPINDILLEIRRERVVELAYEDGLRTYDLFRWHCGEVICRSWEGIWVDNMDPFTFQGATYNFKTSGSATATDIIIATSKAPLTWSLSEGDHGYVTYHNDTDGTWNEKYYTQPVPQSALNVNPKLGQNKLWE